MKLDYEKLQKIIIDMCGVINYHKFDLAKDIDKRFKSKKETELYIVLRYLVLMGDCRFTVRQLAKMFGLKPYKAMRVAREAGYTFDINSIRRKWGNNKIVEMVLNDASAPSTKMAMLDFIFTGEKKLALAKNYCVTDAAIRRSLKRIFGTLDRNEILMRYGEQANVGKNI